MQVYPKESIGIEIVPARVAFTLDQKLNFEDYYQKQAKKQEKQSKRNGHSELNGHSHRTKNGIPELTGKHPTQVVQTLQDIKKAALDMEAKLRDIGMIKGYFNILAKIQTDMDRHIGNIKNPSATSKESDKMMAIM